MLVEEANHRTWPPNVVDLGRECERSDAGRVGDHWSWCI